MKAKEAVVLKSESDKIIVLTTDGEFRSLKWKAPLPLPGEAVMLRKPGLNPRQLLAVALAAAFLLLAVLPSVAWATKPAAYIALDINPSIGLEVVRSGRVPSGEGLNNEGKELLQQVAVKGLLPPEAVEQLVQQAARAGFVTGSDDDIIVISQVNLQLASPPTLDELEAAAARGLATTGTDVFVAVEEASQEELKEAREQNTSLNKLRLQKKLKDTPPKEAAISGHQAKEEKTKESIKAMLAGSGKKAEDVFEKGSLQGKSSKEKGKKRDNNNKPVTKKAEDKKPDQVKPTKPEKKPDKNKKDRNKLPTKPPGLDKQNGRIPNSQKNKKPAPPEDKSNSDKNREPHPGVKRSQRKEGAGGR